MKISEILVKSLMKTAIFEMAYERKHAINVLVNLQDHIAEHLVKACMYEFDNSVNHWQTEMNAALGRINRLKLKSSNGYLDKKTLFDYLFTQPLGTIDDVQNYMNDISRSKDYRGLKIDQPDARIIHEKLFWLLDHTTTQLSNGLFRGIDTGDK